MARLSSMYSWLVSRVRGHGWPSPASYEDDTGAIYLSPPAKRARVHLGCGDRYLRGYLNVDLPPEMGTASGTSRPDVEADVMSVACPPETLSEIRLHHLFEHFERAHALALLLRWYGWLTPGGILTIETPDFEGCIRGFDARSSPEQALILRHLFGSQEAPWAVHLDGWSARRFEEVLSALGFTSISTADTLSDPSRGLLRNVVVKAQRPERGGPSYPDQAAEADAILRQSMNGEGASEQQLLARWRQRFSGLADGQRLP